MAITKWSKKEKTIKKVSVAIKIEFLQHFKAGSELILKMKQLRMQATKRLFHCYSLKLKPTHTSAYIFIVN